MGKIGILVFLFAAVVIAQDAIDIDNTCIYNSKGIYWDIGELKKDPGNYNIPSPYETGTNVIFNIWKQVQCGGIDSYAVIQRTDGSCSLLTDDANNPTVTAVNKDDIDLVFHYTGQQNWIEDSTKKYSFELSIAWSDSENEPQWVESPDNKWLITIKK